ncbi:hypothetical protein [Rhizobium sp. NZLR1b]|nr:hypothetical protein [Rhizobium sp. NZLR1b]
MEMVGSPEVFLHIKVVMGMVISSQAAPATISRCPVRGLEDQGGG